MNPVQIWEYIKAFLNKLWSIHSIRKLLTLVHCHVCVYFIILFKHVYNDGGLQPFSEWVLRHTFKYPKHLSGDTCVSWNHLCQCHTAILTHWGRDKMAAIFQTTFSNPFSWMKLYEFRLRFHWSLFLRVQLTIFHHWFRYWLDAVQATSHYMNQCWLVNWRINASLGLNELSNVSKSTSIFRLNWITNSDSYS